MVEEVGYDRRVAPQAGAALPQASADSFGAGVGAALEQVGNVAHSERLENARIERDLRDNSEYSQFQLDFAKSREEFTMLAADSRESDDPGHAEILAESWRVREQELLGKLTSERLKERASASMAEWASGYRTREALWEQTRQAEITVDRFQESLRISEGRTRRLETVDDYQAEITVQMDAIGGMAVSDEIKEGLIEETEQRLAVAFTRGMIDRDPQAAKALLESGGFDGVLTGDQVEALLNGSAVEIRRQEAQAERERNEAIAQVREQIGLFKDRQSNGFFDQDPEAFAPAIAAAQAIGDARAVEELTQLAADAQFGRIWGPKNANAVQRQRRIGELRGKGGLSDDEVRELKFLERNAPGWASREASDPVGQLIEQGGLAGVALDPADPETFRARSRSVAARFPGQDVSPLTREEGREFGRLFESGGEGRAQVIGLLSQFEPRQAMAAARMMDPDDRTLPVIATLNPQQQRTALRGREILSQNRKFLEERMAGSGLDVDDEMRLGREALDEALKAVPYDQRGAIAETAMQVMAGAMERRGSQWDQEQFARAINFVLGAREVRQPNGSVVQTGGISQWGERSFLLPSGVTKQDFVNAVVQRAAASKDPPVNPDGSPARLSRAYPVLVGDGLYEFHTGTGNALRRKSGKVYRVNVRPR